jgi:hypothetical protein
LQGFWQLERRSVTPEVAGSSPVAPAVEVPANDVPRTIQSRAGPKHDGDRVEWCWAGVGRQEPNARSCRPRLGALVARVAHGALDNVSTYIDREGPPDAATAACRKTPLQPPYHFEHGCRR